MIPTKINLLPPSKKGLLEKLVKFIFFKEILEIVLLVAAFLSVILLWSWYALQNQYNDLSQSALLVNREYSHYNQEIRKLNQIVRQFNTANATFSPLTPKILELIENLPNSIKINSLNINRKNNQIVISGTAQTRDELLKYQSSLKNYSWIESVQTPTSQLFQKDNVNFEIKANTKNIPKINSSQIKKPTVRAENLE
ncbi:MAG: hypothetical protein A2537_00785 [Candidatus Magasanikbacteria bacterium RIFOXYD2_FULL_36_9]|uniref:Uncharacterized protein n=1 Tax=Candidatus Magasanikbacteria bacterium RIFOXYD2_FULL_36_9 TaxID=1798707 RepID=A0A1F6P245_9BACT|nr:MAG: hypothetical protein A2537_00785 [Candidatus Magasanikbacteria bacterium RIFOXYD2_FULL_36_9]